MDMFMMNTMMCMNAHQQMIFQQQVDNNLYIKKLSQKNNSPIYKKHNKNRIKYKKNSVYEENTYGFVPENNEPLFDDREIIDIKSGNLICYMKVDIITKEEIMIKCEMKKGYMFEDDIENLLTEQIVIALSNGYKTIRAAIGKNDEIAGNILEKMGFVVLHK